MTALTDHPPLVPPAGVDAAGDLDWWSATQFYAQAHETMLGRLARSRALSDAERALVLRRVAKRFDTLARVVAGGQAVDTASLKNAMLRIAYAVTARDRRQHAVEAVEAVIASVTATLAAGRPVPRDEQAERAFEQRTWRRSAAQRAGDSPG
jgi:hypothetical protein